MSRILKFKAWDTKQKLLKRLGKIELVKGELIVENHIILQFTGHEDKFGNEIYEKDVLLMEGEKRGVVVWSTEANGWLFETDGIQSSISMEFLKYSMRLCNFYEQAEEN